MDEGASPQGRIYQMWAAALDPNYPLGERLSCALNVLHKMQALVDIAEAKNRDLRAAIAYEIRAELVCCDIYESHDPGKAERAGHAICYWGEAAARIAENRPADEDGF